MKVYRWNIPDNKGLTNLDISKSARKLGTEKFRGVFMRDTTQDSKPQGMRNRKF